MNSVDKKNSFKPPSYWSLWEDNSERAHEQAIGKKTRERATAEKAREQAKAEKAHQQAKAVYGEALADAMQLGRQREPFVLNSIRLGQDARNLFWFSAGDVTKRLLAAGSTSASRLSAKTHAALVVQLHLLVVLSYDLDVMLNLKHGRKAGKRNNKKYTVGQVLLEHHRKESTNAMASSVRFMTLVCCAVDRFFCLLDYANCLQSTFNPVHLHPFLSEKSHDSILRGEPERKERRLREDAVKKCCGRIVNFVREMGETIPVSIAVNSYCDVC